MIDILNPTFNRTHLIHSNFWMNHLTHYKNLLIKYYLLYIISDNVLIEMAKISKRAVGSSSSNIAAIQKTSTIGTSGNAVNIQKINGKSTLQTANKENFMVDNFNKYSTTILPNSIRPKTAATYYTTPPTRQRIYASPTR